jgi:hypothetical protein
MHACTMHRLAPGVTASVVIHLARDWCLDLDDDHADHSTGRGTRGRRYKCERARGTPVSERPAGARIRRYLPERAIQRVAGWSS